MRGRTAETGAGRQGVGAGRQRGVSCETRGWELKDSGVIEKYFREKIDAIWWEMGERGGWGETVGWKMGDSGVEDGRQYPCPAAQQCTGNNIIDLNHELTFWTFRECSTSTSRLVLNQGSKIIDLRL